MASSIFHPILYLSHAPFEVEEDNYQDEEGGMLSHVKNQMVLKILQL